MVSRVGTEQPWDDPPCALVPIEGLVLEVVWVGLKSAGNFTVQCPPASEVEQCFQTIGFSAPIAMEFV